MSALSPVSDNHLRVRGSIILAPPSCADAITLSSVVSVRRFACVIVSTFALDALSVMLRS